ncbi:response regulator [Cohnella thailandensis]|uniref:Response regulator n=1 Tax=Cohnella thailandensis TaxID=557557 RepID=A0A841SXY2_9BACL|nr:response regulator [Cohnella thailandensis]MBB6634700.1 response regulator [Cohnella thailandensis]MBP1972744.1 two-component SAPR family response regulator [Cohnella thailandensis]
MKVMLVDDEPVMHLIMRKMLEKHPEIEVAGTFSDSQAASAFLMENKDVELAFVDISMPGGSGLEFAARLEDERIRPQIVFVTSHKDYALEAFELYALDYLIKPVTHERLERTVHRALKSRKPALSLPTEELSAAIHNRAYIATLGDFSVRSDKGRAKWISSKSAELFAYLLLHRGRWISRQRLLGDIFAGMIGSNAEKYLNTTVYQLRKSLEPIGLREAVRSENDGYALELEHAFVDYEEFERRTAILGKLHAGNAEEAAEVEKAYTGELFGSKSYVWAIQERERLAALYTAFVLEAVEVLLELPDLAAASKLLAKLHARDPLDEAVVGLLMKKHGKSRDKKGLTAQYTDYVKLLNKELGIKPSKELLLLYDSLVSGLTDSAK